MASIDFYTEAGYDYLTDLSGSGLGFYGSAGFGASVAVGAYQGTTYCTDANGTTEGPQANNVKWTHASSGEITGSVQLNLLDIPNYQATLNIRFTHGSAVQVQNAELRIYDRNDINAGASGVTTKVAEIVHPDYAQTGTLGSGNWNAENWYTPVGSNVVVPLSQSPGTSGAFGGTSTCTRADTRHDWYLAISCSPTTIGAKLFGLYCSLEYL